MDQIFTIPSKGDFDDDKCAVVTCKLDGKEVLVCIEALTEEQTVVVPALPQVNDGGGIVGYTTQKNVDMSVVFRISIAGYVPMILTCYYGTTVQLT